MITLHKIFYSPLFIICSALILSESLTAATITLNNHCNSTDINNEGTCVTESTALSIEPWVLQMTQQFEKDCRAEAVGTDGKRAGSINFIFHRDDIKIKEVLSFVNRVTLTGPFSFTASSGISEIDTSTKKLSGFWELFPAGVTTNEMQQATYIQNDFNIYSSYVSSVDVTFYTLPGVSCADIPNIDSLCPNAKNTFQSEMWGTLGTAINARSPSPSISAPAYNFSPGACTELTKPDLSGSIADPHGPAVVSLPTGVPIRDLTGY